MSDLLREISEWQLEAKSEDNARYFYNLNEVDAIVQGKKNYLIGRKGTGKTAISEHIANLAQGSDAIYTEKLSFKNFPFNELYGLNNIKYTPPNQYITIWKYLIYSFICRMMLRNPQISSHVRESLSHSYDLDPIAQLPRIVEQWTSNSFQVEPLTEKKVFETNSIPWINRVNILEDIILAHLDESSYHVIFDELDEDYRDTKNKNEALPYNNLMTSLFKAVQEVRNVFRSRSKKVIPVIFLRDDIYAIIRDPDKNKWSDLKIEVDWDEEKIKKLLAFRISRAIDKDMASLPFEIAWDKVFEYAPVPMGDQGAKRMNRFDFITRSTHIRPRDYVKYLQACALETLEQGDKVVTVQTIKRVDKAFSNYLKSEIEDEIQAVIPEIDMMFQIISQIGKQQFRVEEFKRAYESYLRNGTIAEKDVNYVLQNLYDFSVIGNQPRNRKIWPVFRYKNREARLNLTEKLAVHRGLFKALQIL
jgi:hypothetical protein